MNATGASAGPQASPATGSTVFGSRKGTYSKWTAVLFTVAVVSLSVPLFSILGSRVTVLGLGMATLHNAVVLACTLPIFVKAGLRSRFNPVILAALWMLVASLTLSSRWPGLSVIQSLKTFAALALAAYVFELRLDERTVRWLCALLPWAAAINLAASAVLYVVAAKPLHLMQMGAWRLSGTTIPGHLASIALIGLLFSLLSGLRHLPWLWMAILNYGVVVWTGSRTSMVVGALLILGFQLGRAADRKSRTTFWRREVIALTVSVPFWLISYAPWWGARMAQQHNPAEQIRVTLPGRADDRSALDEFSDSDPERSEDPSVSDELSDSDAGFTVGTTGRLKAWRHYWQVARENLWFGRGLGTGVVAGEGVLISSFRVPHSEYLRLIVDGGLFGLLAMLVGYGVVAGRLVSHAPTTQLKVILVSSIVALALDAAFRNPLISQHFIVPFWLFLGIAGGELPAMRSALTDP